MTLHRLLIVFILFIGMISEVSSQNYVKFTSIQKALENPEEVEYLRLRREGLKEWPSDLDVFPNLKVLDLAHNKIAHIPYNLSYANQIEELILTGNKLDSLEASVAEFGQVKRLLVGNNHIYHVTPKIGQLKTLEFFEVWSNEVHYLPKEISQLETLKEVDMRGIQISEKHQDNIKALFGPDVELKLSMSCNCD